MELNNACRDLRSLDGSAIPRALEGRGLSSKSAPKTSKSSGSAGTKSQPKSKGKCSAKAKSKGKGRRSLSKRASTEVEAGDNRQGSEADRLSTRKLKTCVGLIAVSGKKKILAHINAINEVPQNWDQQYSLFKIKAQALGGTLKVYGSFPDASEGGEHLANTLAEMTKGLRTKAHLLDPHAEFVTRGPGAVGEMLVDENGAVCIDDNLYSH